MPVPLAARNRRLAAVILAAGGSSRLGRSKQLLRVGNEPLIVRSVRLALGLVDGPVVVVLGAGALRLRSCLRRRQAAVHIVYNGAWQSGMAGSLQTGLRAVTNDCAAAIVLLTDQPRLRPAELAQLIDRWRRVPAHPAAAVYGERTGVPAILPRRLFRSVRRIDGDQGARQLLRGLGRLTRVPMPGAAFDLDTPADAETLRRRR